MTERTADLDDVEHDDVRSEAPSSDDRPANGSVPGPATTMAPTSRRERHREQRRHRISKWDRPPEPKDWRYVVGTIGKVLIATGVLMFGFVAYQLWGTGIETARAQDRLESAFEEALSATDETTDDPVGEPTDDVAPPVPTISPEPDRAGPVGEDDTDVDEEPPPEPEPAEPVPSEIIPGGVDLSGVAVEQDVPPIAQGDVIARLEIPKIGQDLYVVAGVSLDDLKNGPGHYPDTPLPGQLGNASIAGHRTTYGAPFFDVDQLVAGDQLVVTSITGGRFVYEVTGVEVVSASDYWVVTTRDPNVAELTLTSCHPKYTARDRIVVHSVLVPELSDPVGLPEFYAVDEAGTGAIPGDDPTVTDPDAAATSDDEAATDTEPAGTIVATVDDDAAIDLTGGDEPTTSEPAVTTGGVAAGDDEATGEVATGEAENAAEIPDASETEIVDEPEPIDAFSEGWFDDEDAWAQIALWGFALTLVSLLAHLVSKKTRHDSVGILVGIAPFLFCLYFFFQNINRLLPPGF